MTTTAASTRTHPGATWKATFAAGGLGAAGALVVNIVLATAGRAVFNVPSTFQPLTLAVYGPLTVLGALIGAIGWRLAVNRSRDPGRLLTRLVPAVLVLSFIPDIVLGVSGSQPGTTTGGVINLMLLHLGVAAAALPAYRRFMPPRP